jgi:membrane fusion protein, multidrug efflux system
MKFLKSYWIILLLLTSSLIYSGCTVTDEKEESGDSSDSTKVEQKEDSNSENEEKKDKEKDLELIPVEVTKIKNGTISNYILLSTNLETESQADVFPRIQGIVKKINHDEGDFVKSGQTLMELEADEYVLSEQRAELNYKKQEADFERLKSMFSEDLLSKEEFEQSRYATEGLKVDWKQAELNLSYTKIKSPINGVIGDRLRKPGDRIQPTDKLFSVINTNEMIAIVYVPEKEIGRVKKGQKAFITSDNLKNTRFKGWLKRVSPVIDPASGTFKVTIGVKNVDGALRAGMFVNAYIVTAVHKDAVLIPKTALVYENEAMSVFVVKDSLAHKITLDIGFEDHEKIESLEGIEEGDKVIVVGQAGLKDQTKVKIVSERENTIAMKKDEISD